MTRHRDVITHEKFFRLNGLGLIFQSKDRRNPSQKIISEFKAYYERNKAEFPFDLNPVFNGLYSDNFKLDKLIRILRDPRQLIQSQKKKLTDGQKRYSYTISESEIQEYRDKWI